MDSGGNIIGRCTIQSSTTMHILFCMCLVNIVGVVCSNLIYKRLQLCGGNFILLKEGTQYLFGNGNKWYKERSYLEKIQITR